MAYKKTDKKDKLDSLVKAAGARKILKKERLKDAVSDALNVAKKSESRPKARPADLKVVATKRSGSSGKGSASVGVATSDRPKARPSVAVSASSTGAAHTKAGDAPKGKEKSERKSGWAKSQGMTERALKANAGKQSPLGKLAEKARADMERLDEPAKKARDRIKKKLGGAY